MVVDREWPNTIALQLHLNHLVFLAQQKWWFLGCLSGTTSPD